MKKIILFISIIFFSVILGGCASSESPDGYGSIGDGAPDSMPPTIEGTTDEGPDNSQIQAGQITASAWSDNENYLYWLDLITASTNQSETEKHYLAAYYDSFVAKAPGLESKNMIKLVFQSDDKPLENAKVTARINSQELFKGVTNAEGVVYIFLNEFFDTNIVLDINYYNQTFTTTIQKIPESREVIVNASEITPVNSDKILDLALVIDTTGSMGDELEYLKVELQNVIQSIEELEIPLTIRLALIFYRDNGDDYVTRVFDFTDNVDVQYNNISRQTAKGGGDLPEAVHSAFAAAENLSWSENSTKIMINVCDAPPHNDTTILQNVVSSTKKFAELGVRVIPVICSGSDYLTELIFREVAIYTGGTYTYVTDHSGIGGSHTDPSTPNSVVVEYLNKMLIRLIKEYITGEDIPAVSFDGESKPNTPSDEYFIVTFNTNSGTSINPQMIPVGGFVNEPVEPVKEGHTFIGWYTYEDSVLTQYNFTTPVTENFELIAIFVENN